MKAVVLHSGGLDSTTLISQAIDDGADDIIAVSIRYGSLHNEAEGQAAQEVIKWFRENLEVPVKIERLVFDLPSEIFQSNRSALMGEIEMPHITYQEIQESKGPSPTVVPFRNANLISIATAIADARGYNFVYIGAHADDAHEWAYPDCTPEFLGAMANAVRVGTYDKVRLAFPFIWMQKNEIVQRAAAFGTPLFLTWSCYSPTWVDARIAEFDVEEGHFEHCGKCPTCIERAYAFAEAGFIDPTNYFLGVESIIGGEYNMEDLEEWPS